MFDNVCYVDVGLPLPKPPPAPWIPGQENRNFKGVDLGNGSIEKFILNNIPRIRDRNQPVLSIASTIGDFVAQTVFSAMRDSKKR
jgi:hypothetical protein